MKTKTVILSLLIGLTSFAAERSDVGGSFGGGGVTYTAAFEEARQIALHLFQNNKNLNGLSKRLETEYLKKRETWLEKLKNFSIGKSDVPLFVVESNEPKEKAALANLSTNSVDLSFPYLEKNPISPYQLIVLAVHESGHLAEVKLSHDELDQVGIAVANANLLNKDGILIVKSPRDFTLAAFTENSKPVNTPKFLGQNVAKQQVDSFLKAASKPKVLVYFGTDGLGKVNFNEVLAAQLGMELRVLQMAFFNRIENLTTLLGASPMYVGYQREGGLLAQWLNAKKPSIIVLDEIDRAHPDVLKTILTLAEKGEIIDNAGVTVNIGKSIIVMTLSAGQQVIDAYDQEILNIAASEKEKSHYAGEVPKDEDSLREELLEVVRQDSQLGQLGNKISANNIVVFHQPDKEERQQIVELEVKKVIGELAQSDEITVDVEPAVMNFLVEKGFSYRYGWWKVRDLARQHISHPIAHQLFKADLEKNQKIVIRLNSQNKPEVSVVPK
jgi:hypothetical protein